MSQSAQTTPEPFQIGVLQAVIDDLQMRLHKTRWSRVSHDESSWEYGTSRRYLRDLISYWQSSYDWREHETRLNALPHFKASIDGAGIHFMHAHGLGEGAMPLLLLHGWPDSFYRFHKVIPAFTDPAGAGGDARDSLHVVVPSLPGFAFTGALPRAPRTQPTRYSAELLWRLMTEVLGYERFFVAGGDGGSVLAQILAIDHPESVIAIHVTDLGWHVYNADPSSLSKREQAWLEASTQRFQNDGAYAAVQTTRPRSLAASLNDSPVGLASWIVDRFHSWCDFESDLDEAVSKDDLLTNIMLYWVTQTIGSSMFNYYAEAQSPALTPSDHVQRPVGVALFPKEIGGVPPRSLAERTLNVQRWTELPRGGHFAALEQPELFVRDVVDFCRPLRTLQQSREESRHVARTL
jgi:microsomal epoxide hydrolase